MQSSPWPWNNDNPNPFDAIQKVSLDFSVEVIKDQHQKSRDFVNLFFQNHLSSLSWCCVCARCPDRVLHFRSKLLIHFWSPRAKSDVICCCMYVRKRTRQLFLTPSNWFGIEPPFHSCSKICKNDAILFFFHQFKIKAVVEVELCISWLWESILVSTELFWLLTMTRIFFLFVFIVWCWFIHWDKQYEYPKLHLFLVLEQLCFVDKIFRFDLGWVVLIVTW